MSGPHEAPAWKQRAVERSTKAAKLRAEQRVERFLDAAQTIIAKRGTTDFTVQEVVDRSHQSLRSFYQHFNGKQELLLALFEDAVRRASDRIRAATSGRPDPLDRLEAAVRLLFELAGTGPAEQRSLFTDLAPQLQVSHPAQTQVAHAPLLDLFTELMSDAGRAGRLRPGVDPHRMATMTVRTVVCLAQSTGPTADEFWDFCAHGFVGHTP